MNSAPAHLKLYLRLSQPTVFCGVAVDGVGGTREVIGVFPEALLVEMVVIGLREATR